MKGSIRFFLGLLIAAGAVGGIEAETSTLLQGTVLAIAGLILMNYGVSAMKESV